MKSLVVFYSLTGKTKLVSKTIAEELSATLVEIEEMKPRKLGFLTYLTCGFAAVINKGSEINPIDVDLMQYDRVFIGSPLWASRPTPAINSFIYKTNFEGQNIVPFFTMRGNNSDKAFRNIITKIERSKGTVIGSFAIRSFRSTDKEIIANTKKVINNYLN